MPSETPVPSASLEPPFDVAYKMQRLALDIAWRAYTHDTEQRERLATWLREHGLAVWRLHAEAIAAQREALLTYGKHKPGCTSGWRAATGSSEVGPCDCGLAAALDAFPGGER